MLRLLVRVLCRSWRCGRGAVGRGAVVVALSVVALWSWRRSARGAGGATVRGDRRRPPAGPSLVPSPHEVDVALRPQPLQASRGGFGGGDDPAVGDHPPGA